MVSLRKTTEHLPWFTSKNEDSGLSVWSGSSSAKLGPIRQEAIAHGCAGVIQEGQQAALISSSKHVVKQQLVAANKWSQDVHLSPQQKR